MSVARPPAPPPPAPPPPPERYKLALYGGGVEEVDRFEVRDRIRRGDVDSRTQLARVGTDDWKPAGAFPELARYVDLAREKRAVVSLSQGPARAQQAHVGSMSQEIVEGLAYPLKGAGILTTIGIAIFSSIPFIGLLSVPILTVYVLAIVRSSSNGERELPAWVETSDVVGNLILWLKTWFVTIIALWPVVLWVAVWLSSHPSDRFSRDALASLVLGLAAAGLVSMLYFPACLATIAVWDSVLDSLNPVYVFAVIRRIGWDYVAVVVTYVAATGASTMLALLSNSALSALPILGSIPGKIPIIWAQFYTAHLLGWAVYRHADELGWD
ncbi:MAG TPA: DUF4013 domain-containing protein [Thermoanaerobaculia bacterium]|nr:DUF4013 domain-containing protein [Thermoanaerobaculia bacterium]